MFSLINKEPSLGWIGRAVTNRWPFNMNKIKGMQMQSASVASSVNDVHDGCQGQKEGGHWGESNEIASVDQNRIDGSGGYVIVDMDGIVEEAGGRPEGQFANQGGISQGVVLGGVILGGVVIRDDESGQEEEAACVMEGSGGEEKSVCGGGDAGHVTIDIEANCPVAAAEQDEPILSGPSRYLKRCQDMSYYFCVSAYRPFQKKRAANWYSMAGRILQKAINCPSIWASLIQSICMIKFNYLRILSDKSYSTYVAFAFAFACLLVKIYSSVMLSFKKKKTERMLTVMHEYEVECHSSNAPVKAGSWKLKLVTLLAISTLLCAGTSAVFGGGGKTAEDVILDASLELSQDIFVWNSNETRNDTLDLINTYGTQMTGGTVTMGLFVLFRDYANYLQVGMVFDLVVGVTSVIFAYVVPLIKEIKAVTPNVSFANIAEWRKLQARREDVWRKYVKLRSVKDEVNDIFDPLFKLLHMRNLTAYAFFMSLLIFRDYPWIFIVICGVNLVKAEIAYYFAGKIAEVNDAMRALIHNWAKNTGKITVEDEEIDAGIILDQLEKDPIGLGKGKFLINHAFHFKFAGLVWSVFFGMSDEETKE